MNQRAPCRKFQIALYLISTIETSQLDGRQPADLGVLDIVSMIHSSAHRKTGRYPSSSTLDTPAPVINFPLVQEGIGRERARLTKSDHADYFPFHRLLVLDRSFPFTCVRLLAAREEGPADESQTRLAKGPLTQTTSSTAGWPTSSTAFGAHLAPVQFQRPK